MLALELVLLVCLGAARLFLPNVPLIALDLPILLLNAIFAALLLTRLGWWRAAGFRAVQRPRDLILLALPVALLIVPALVVGVDVPPLGKALALLFVTLLIAFQEEAIFRGVILHGLTPLGTLHAVLGSALLFGVIHANSLLVGRDPAFVAVQVIASILGGVGSAALRLRFGAIWPLIALHTLNDFIQFSASQGLAVEQASPVLLIAKLGISTLMALYGFFLLRGMEIRMWPVRAQSAAAP
ncbi:CPBP family intramembrane glutamic endopeptidase [Deinococcus navajonensis]|uniref:CPBP family intramembrane glutamic endopeptidase n=1 Tax=Deinococcus navajonensis TaxID=309884 RepID=A0ABV8XKR4_9DEIO